MTWSVAGSYWTVHMQKILLLLAVAGAAVFLVQRRRQAAAAEAALWDEATGKPSTAGGYPGPVR
jgi:hypothetical protein